MRTGFALRKTGFGATFVKSHGESTYARLYGNDSEPGTTRYVLAATASCAMDDA